MENPVSAKDEVASLKNQVDNMVERKPFLKETLNAFKELMIAEAELRAELMTRPAPGMPPPDALRLSAGVPALSDMELAPLFPDLTDGLKTMLAALKRSFPPLKKEAERLAARVAEDPEAPAAWIRLLVRNEEDALKKWADELELEPASFRFALEKSLKPFLQWLAHGVAPHLEQMSWDRGYCPICGAYPDTSYLKKGEEESEYLVAHGGRRWLHCALCSHEWRLHRIVCPYCGNEDADTLEYFSSEESPAERLHVCHTCKKYLPCLDTSELIEVPPADLMPFELLHLDLIAQEKGFSPMAWRHWNQLTS
ncbi:MAG: formate dehydrogenase accessory protein FdhE [Deltaproteobacteria bacterium]|nr:formate dehydrogenase accessory protein FdhE [Deltaproteobacteria bacterium]